MEAEVHYTLFSDADILDSGFRRSVFTFSAQKVGFVQKESESTKFKSFSDVVEFLKALGPNPQSSKETSAPRIQAMSSKSITVFELPLPKRITRYERPVLSRFLAQNINSRLRSLLSGVNQTSTTGRLFSKDQHGILFETPSESVPYMQFWLKKVEAEGIQGDWLALLAYEKESELGEHSLDVFKLHMERYIHFDYEDPSAAKAPFQASTEFLRTFVRMYVIRVEKDAKGFMEAINEVENSLNSDQRPSSLLRSLNTISRKLRAASLESRVVFSVEAAKWANNIPGSRANVDMASESPLLARDMERYRPDRLREVAAEVHQHIEDVIAERQQERQEKLQELEDVRRKEEWELLEKNFEIAKATQRDSRLMSGVAWVTMAFLPATFVSSFFGMNFFNGIAGNVPFDEASRSVWLFFAIAIPISAAVLYTFHVWDRREERKAAKKKEEDEENLLKSDKNKME